MVAKQVIFRDIFGDDFSLPNGGIAIYEDFGQRFDCPSLELQGVICGECGDWIEAENCEILEVLEQWWTLDEAIKDNVKPDGTRGFRPENQISMKFD